MTSPFLYLPVCCRFTAWPCGSLPSSKSRSEQLYPSIKLLSRAAIGSAAVRGSARKRSSSTISPRQGVFEVCLSSVGTLWMQRCHSLLQQVKNVCHAMLLRVWWECALFLSSHKRSAVKTQEKVESASVTKSTSAKVSVPECESESELSESEEEKRPGFSKHHQRRQKSRFTRSNCAKQRKKGQ